MRKNFGPKPYMYPMPVLILASYDENNKRLYGSEAIKYFRQHNKEWIRDNMWTEICPSGEIVEREEGG